MNLLPVTFTGDRFQVEGQTIPCPEPLRAYCTIGQRLELGIRPEHLHVRAVPEHLVVEVSVVEPLGRETLVRAGLPNGERSHPLTLNLQAPADYPLRPGDRLSLSLDLQQVLLFDPGSGDRLYPPPSPEKTSVSRGNQES